MHRFVAYGIFFVAYLFILILLSILVQPFLGLLLWVLAALILYSLADQYGRDVPWIQKLLEDLEFKYSETYESVTESTINDGGNEDKSIIEKTGDSAKYYSNKIRLIFSKAKEFNQSNLFRKSFFIGRFNLYI